MPHMLIIKLFMNTSQWYLRYCIPYPSVDCEYLIKYFIRIHSTEHIDEPQSDTETFGFAFRNAFV